MSDGNIEKVRPAGALAAAPTHIQRGDDKQGVERTQEFVSPPFLKIVQKQSDDELITTHGVGSTILTPTNVLVAKHGDSFKFVPIIQYAEFMTWADIGMKGLVPPILDRSLDSNSKLARKCRDRNLWVEEGYDYDGKKLKVRHVEHITFVVVIMDEELGAVPCIMSFSRAEHKQGRNLCSLLSLRNADIFGCVFEARVGDPRKNEKGSWHGFDVFNPTSDSPWVDDPKVYETLQALHIQYEKLYNDGLLRASYEDEQPEEPATSEM